MSVPLASRPGQGDTTREVPLPAVNPRIGVVVTSDQHKLLTELGALQGRSTASFLRELLDAAEPMLQAMLPVYRAAAAQVAMQPEALQMAIRDALGEVDGKRAQLDLLRLLAASEGHSANDADADSAPSGAREDAGARRRRRRS